LNCLLNFRNPPGEGCRIRSQKKFNKGDYLSVQLCLPKPDWPLTIELAVVRWVMEDDFGVEFVSMPPSDRDRLRHFLSSATKQP